jgi:1,4-dihydroxy-2-naphthoate octaprenyltransferase
MYTALTYAFCLCWISALASVISIVFTQPPYNFGTVGVGNMSLGVFIGCILGSVYGAISDRAILWFTRRNYGYYEPEMRLQLNHFPALCMGSGFIMFGVTASKVRKMAQYLQSDADEYRECIGFIQALAVPSLALVLEDSVMSHYA